MQRNLSILQRPLAGHGRAGVGGFSRRELALLAGVVMLAVLACCAPALAQPARYHAFADQRSWTIAWTSGWTSLPHAMDVLSNLPFAWFGALGLAWLARAVRCQSLGVNAVGLLALFFGGLIVTAGASSAYHWQPHNTGLAWDRIGMVLPFAGLMGLAALQAVGQRAGIALAGAVLCLGPLSVYTWSQTGNLLPWAVLQFGGMALIVVLALLRPVQAVQLPIRWGLVMAIYALAKVLELADHQVWELLGHSVSGHSLKHIVASLAALPVIAALRLAITPVPARSKSQQ